jgi:hypothetical protein
MAVAPRTPVLARAVDASAPMQSLSQ